MFKKIFLILLFLLFANTISYACMCLPTGRPHFMNSLQSAYQNTSYIMVIRLDSVERIPGFPDDSFLRGLNFTIEKVYKGNVLPGEKGLLSNGIGVIREMGPLTNRTVVTGGCTLKWKREDVGKRLLFYSRGPEDGTTNQWTASICAPPAHADAFPADLAFFEKAPLMMDKTRISGRAWLDKRDPNDKSKGLGPLANAKIVIRAGGKKRVVTTDANGVYEIYGLPPGEFTATIRLPEDTVFGNYNRESFMPPLRVGKALSPDEFVQKEAALNAKLKGEKTETAMANLYPGAHTTIDFYLRPKDQK